MCCRGRSDLYVEFSCCVRHQRWETSCIWEHVWLSTSAALSRVCLKCPLLLPVVVLKQLTSGARRHGHNDHTTDSRLINVLWFLRLCADTKVLEDAFKVCGVYERCLKVFCLWNDSYCPPTVKWLSLTRAGVMMPTDAPRCWVEDVFQCLLPRCVRCFDEVWVCCSCRCSYAVTVDGNVSLAACVCLQVEVSLYTFCKVRTQGVPVDSKGSHSKQKWLQIWFTQSITVLDRLIYLKKK